MSKLTILILFSMAGLVVLPVMAAEPRKPSGAESLTARELDAVFITRSADKAHLKVTFTAKTAKKLPKSFVARINDKDIQVVDSAGTGRFSGTVAIQEAAKLSNTLTERIVNGKIRRNKAEPPTTTTPKKVVVCTVETVECPPNCTSSIFHAPCIICLKIVCKITIG